MLPLVFTQGKKKLNDKKVFILICTIAPISSLIWLYSNYESIVVGSIVGTCYVVWNLVTWTSCDDDT
jgi:hypothetical protein